MRSNTIILGLLLLLAVSSAQDLSGNYYHDLINVVPAWDISTGEGVAVALIDSGVVWNAKLPQSLRWENMDELSGEDGVDDDDNGLIDDYYGYDFVDDDNNTAFDGSSQISNERGTHMAGILASPHDSEPRGLAPDIRIMDLRIVDNAGEVSLDAIKGALNYALVMNADVVSLAIEIDGTVDGDVLALIEELLDENDNPVPVITMESNYGTGMFNASGLLAAGTTDSLTVTSDRPKHTVYGHERDLTTVDMNGGLVNVSNIMYAVPQVSAAVALMLALDNDIPHKYIGDVLLYSGEVLVYDVAENFAGLDVYTSVVNWRDFKTKDFNGDGKLAGEELEQGLDPFYYETTATIDFKGYILIVPLLMFYRKKRKR